ncbi:MAG: hypothetical protein AAF721_25630 [Myxococcota bacterium]
MADPRNQARGTAGPAAALLLAASGCQPLEINVGIDILLPADESPLSRTNNVSLVIEPLGNSQTITADGLDFTLSVTLPPQGDPQQLSLFLAENETLLAWGRTPDIALSGASSGAALLVAQPDAMSLFAAEFDAPDPDATAAAVGDVGMLVLAADGTTLFMDVFAWELRAAAPMPVDAVRSPSDGALVADADGGVQRITVVEQLTVTRYSPVDNEWKTRAVDDESQARFGARPGAALLPTAGGNSVWVIGGGEHTDVVGIPLVEADEAPVDPVGVPSLDAPRPGATAALVTRGEGELSSAVLFGAADDRPVVWAIDLGVGFGPVGPWIGAACTPLDPPDPDATLRLLCLGGTRHDEATGDAVVISLPPPGDPAPPTATELTDLLQGPMAAPLALRGADAVYAQGDVRALDIALTDLTATPAKTQPERARGGHATTLPLGYTFIVGGVTADDTPLSRWSMFIPGPG